MTRRQANASRAASRTQGGMSLIELMIAIVLGALLLLGLVQIFGGVRNTFGTNESLSRIQENSRFALEFIRRDVRMAGHLGCLNEFGHFPRVTARPTEPEFTYYTIAAGEGRDTVAYTLRVDRAIEIYDYSAVATSPGDSYTISSPSPTPPNAAANFTPALPDELGITATALPGSDVIVVRFFDEAAVNIEGMITDGSGEMTIPAGAMGAMQSGAYYGVTNCLGAALFAVTGLGANSIKINAAPNILRPNGQWWDNTTNHDMIGFGSLLHRYRMYVYYVGLGTNGPALMRRGLPEAGGSALGPAEEIVEGVEMMQLVVGVDDDRNDVTDRYASGSGLLATASDDVLRETELRKINSVRVSLLMRGNASRANVATPATQNVGDVRVTVPADGRVRQTYDTVIALRNRLRA